MLSTIKLVISMPYFPCSAGLIIGDNASPSSEYLIATSSAGTFELASASLKIDTIRERMASENSSILKKLPPEGGRLRARLKVAPAPPASGSFFIGGTRGPASPTCSAGSKQPSDPTC